MNLLKVENEPYLYRDKESKAIITDDKNGLISYRKSRDAALNQKKEIEEMKTDISDIKLLLNQILNSL
jgi:hypothetical protein